MPVFFWEMQIYPLYGPLFICQKSVMSHANPLVWLACPIIQVWNICLSYLIVPLFSDAHCVLAYILQCVHCCSNLSLICSISVTSKTRPSLRLWEILCKLLCIFPFMIVMMDALRVCCEQQPRQIVSFFRAKTVLTSEVPRWWIISCLYYKIQ